MSHVRHSFGRIGFGAVVGVLLYAGTGWAQQAAGIAGVVRDTSGGVLPGVTVEAASPALIEQLRVAVTDDQGRYNVTELPPGAYTVTFSLPGFNVVRRDGITLQSGFTATVNVDLPVGSLEETITVSGAAPLVDTSNVRRQTVASSDLLATLPVSTKNVAALVTLTAGWAGISDVGGRYTSEVGAFHGKRGTKVAFDGMGMENSSGNSSYQLNAAVVQEMSAQTSGVSAEVNADGPVLNIVPKEGSNTLNVIANGLFTNHKLESGNLTDDLRERGVSDVNTTYQLYDETLSAGGPIERDRLWFFGAARTWGFGRQHAGVYWNKTQDVFLTPPDAENKVVLWTPWVDRPLDESSGRLEWYESFLGRVTWQASPRNKFNVMVDHQTACNCYGVSPANSQEAAGDYKFQPNLLTHITWSSPRTSRLLMEAGVALTNSQWNAYWHPGVTPNHIRITDQTLGVSYGAQSSYRGWPGETDRYTQRFSTAYVTGTHSFKTGVQVEQLVANVELVANGNRNYTFRGGVPISITQLSTPYLRLERGNEFGLFVQDQWILDRLTVNLGMRYDWFYGWVPAQQTPGDTSGWPGAPTGNAWLGERSFAKVTGVPSWHDINPRVGAAYDLFGDGRTALKMALGRYVAKTNTDVPGANNPIVTSVNSVNRAWNDVNRNYVPDCDLGNFAANGECGAIANANFGKNNPLAERWDSSVLQGWGVRDSNWDLSTEVQHQLLSGLSVTAGYYWNSGGYFRNQASSSKNRLTDNLAVGPADYDHYCITAPLNSRLPGGGGYEVCGLYDINPAKFGQVENLVRHRSDFGDVEYANHFVNLGFDARLGGGARIGGGFDTGRSLVDRCLVVDSPQILLTCRVVTPFKAQTQLKLNGSYPLPGDLVVSGALQNISGPAFEANYPATTAEIAPSLGRPLAGGTRTATVPLVAPQTLFEDRITRLDLRLSKIFQIRRMRLQVNLDAYNALNSDAVITGNDTFDSRWREPNLIIDPRHIQIGGQISF
jgi:hypothetical protein